MKSFLATCTGERKTEQASTYDRGLVVFTVLRVFGQQLNGTGLYCSEVMSYKEDRDSLGNSTCLQGDGRSDRAVSI